MYRERSGSLRITIEQRWSAYALCARALFPARVHDARAERSKHDKEGMEEREFGARRLVYDEALQGMF